MLDEDGFQVAPDWVYWFADVIMVVSLVAITYYVTVYYSHSNDRYSRHLTNLNLFATLLTLIFHIVLLYWPPLCAFYLVESVFFTCEFNLFQYRTALFYQSEKPFYNRLFHGALIINILSIYHNLIALATYFRMTPLTYGCRSVIQLKTLTVALPLFALKTYFLVLGYYTVFKFWKNSNDDSRRKMRILWLILVTYSCDYFTAIANIAYSGNSDTPLYLPEVVSICNKMLSLFLAFIIYLRVRERDSTKASQKTTIRTSRNSSVDSGQARNSKMTQSPAAKSAGRHDSKSVLMPQKT